MASAFFYGTLMYPKILQRVIGHDGSYLQIRPAILLDYTRHKVHGEDYPGIVPYSRNQEILSEREERCVRGSVVVGLSDKDMRFLDTFEGDEYTRELVLVHPLGPLTSLDEAMTRGAPSVPPGAELTTALKVNTYVWCRPLSRLEPKPWSLEEFVQESAWKWVGTGSEHYNEVDRRRDMDGVIITGNVN